MKNENTKNILKLVTAALVLALSAPGTLADTSFVGGFAAVVSSGGGNHAIAASGGFGNDISLESTAYAVSDGDVSATGKAFMTGDYASSGGVAGSAAGEDNSAGAIAYARGIGDASGYTISNAWSE